MRWVFDRHRADHCLRRASARRSALALLLAVPLILLLARGGDLVADVNAADEPQSQQSRASASGPLALAPDGSTLFLVNPDSGSVSRTDTLARRKTGEVYVGKGPRTLALSPDGSRIYVACEGASALVILDAARLALLAEIETGAEPYGVVVDPAGVLAYVASAADSSVDVVDLSGAGRRVARIPVGPKPKGLAMTADGSRLYVTHFLTGEVSVIDTARREVVDVVSTGPDSNMAQKILIHPSNRRAYIPHIRSDVTNPSLLFDTTVFPVVSVIDLQSNQHVSQERVDLSVGRFSVNLPFDVAFSPDGQRLYVANLGRAIASHRSTSVRAPAASRSALTVGRRSFGIHSMAICRRSTSRRFATHTDSPRRQVPSMSR
jgi:YVTN family beta-propeller protein